MTKVTFEVLVSEKGNVLMGLRDNDWRDALNSGEYGISKVHCELRSVFADRADEGYKMAVNNGGKWFRNMRYENI